MCTEPQKTPDGQTTKKERVESSTLLDYEAGIIKPHGTGKDARTHREQNQQPRNKPLYAVT